MTEMPDVPKVRNVMKMPVVPVRQTVTAAKTLRPVQTAQFNRNPVIGLESRL